MNVVVVLVVVALVGGHHTERHATFTSTDECWVAARAELQHLVDEHPEGVTRVGVGCTVDLGAPL